MAFTPKDWRDSPSDLTTPITAAALEDMETRLSAYTDLVGVQIAGPFLFAGPLVTAIGSTRFRFPMAVTLLGVSAAVGTAPTGASVIVDVNKNGTTIYSTQANRPAVAISANHANETTPNTTAMAAGDYLTADVDQVGSTIAGADLTVFVRYRIA